MEGACDLPDPNHFHLVVETPRGNLVAGMNLKRRGWSDEELRRRAKGDVQKVSIAVRARRETAMTVKWIANRLQMGAPRYVNHLLYCRRKAKGK